MKYELWTENVSISDQPTLAWETPTLTFKARLYELILEVDSNDIDVIIEIDNSEVFSFNLNDIKLDFQLEQIENFSFKEYFTNKWRWKPYGSLLIFDSLRVYMKAPTGLSSECVRGMTIWNKFSNKEID